MKKALFSILLAVATTVSAFAIVPDSSKQGIQAVMIVPQTIVFGQPQAKSLGLRVVSDNLSDAAGLYYVFYDSDGAEYNTVYEGNIDIKGADYAAWKSSGGNNYLFTWFAGKFGITLRED